MFYLEAVLKDKLCKKGLIPVKCSYDIEKNEIVLDSANIDDLIEYAEINNIRHVFYKYWYLEEEDYLIDAEAQRLRLEEYFDVVAKDIDAHNRKIKTYNFSQPATLVAFCLHEGALILIHADNSWVEGLVTAEAAMLLIRGKYEHQLGDLKAKKTLAEEAEIEKLENELRALLFDNEEFGLCTNQSMRKAFIYKFLDKAGNEKYKNLFINGFGNFVTYEATAFAETVFAKKKALLKKT